MSLVGWKHFSKNYENIEEKTQFLSELDKISKWYDKIIFFYLEENLQA